MDDIKDRPSNRRTVIELTIPPIENKSLNRNVVHRRKKKNFSTVSEKEEVEFILPQANQPIELTPVIDAVKEYGRRTFSLGAWSGANELHSLVDKIKKLDANDDKWKCIIEDAEKSICELRSHMYKTYKD